MKVVVTWEDTTNTYEMDVMRLLKALRVNKTEGQVMAVIMRLING